MDDDQILNREQTAVPRAGCLSHGLFAATVLWALLATFGVQGAGWLIRQVLIIQEMPAPAWAWPSAVWINALLLALPLAPAAALTRPSRLRAVYQCWLGATAFMAVMALVRFLPAEWTQEAALAQTILALVATAVLWRLARRRGRPAVGRPGLALALSALVLAPWLAMGALGSVLDFLLNLLAAISFGVFAGLLLEVLLAEPLKRHSSGPGRDIVFGGLAAGVTLAILGGGFGFGGSELLLLAALPPLGFAAMALALPGETPATAGRGWVPVAILVGLAAAGPLMFFDPDEISLLLDSGDIPGWAARAAGLSVLIASALGLGLWALRHRQPRPRAALALPMLLLPWAGAIALYFFVGQPGFYGEQLFVILRDQADVSQASSIANLGDRRRYVYETLTGHATTTQASLRADLDRLHLQYTPYYLVNALEVRGGPLVRLYLSTRPEIDRVLDSPHLRPLPEPLPVSTGHEQPPNGPQWNVTSVGADRVWRDLGVTGSGIVIGQSDSGVQGDHPALRDDYRGRQGGNDYNWLDPWNGTSSPNDSGGHGTHTLGSILGRGGIGIAPDAEWIACTNLPRNMGNPARYLNCMQFMLAPYPQRGDSFRDGDPSRAADVLNNSWGCTAEEGCDAQSLGPAVKALRAAGIFFVASAGNAGPRCGSVIDPPAIYTDALSVGAMDRQGNVADFSSRGPVIVDGSGRIKPDLLAPGVDVLSSFPGSSYAIESGTSMAGPQVAGVVALMWSAQPKLIGDIERTESILLRTARPYGGQEQGCFSGGIPDDAYGYGVVDAYAAVKAAQEMK